MTDSKGNTSVTTTYTLSITYQVGATMYNGSVNSSEPISNGAPIMIKVNPNNPQDISYNEVGGSTIGLIMCAIAAFLFIFSGMNFYFSRTNKAWAAVQGVGTGVSVVSRAFQH